MKKQVTYLLIACTCMAAMTGSRQTGFPLPDGWPQPVYDFHRNPLHTETIELGRNLFYDPILSADGKISCASCHNPYNAFAHADHALSHGIGDRSGNRNAPALFNLAWQKRFMWDGAITDLDMQALAPISHPDEMGETIAHVVEKISHEKHYQEAFARAWGSPEVNSQRILFSLSQFMLSLVSSHAKYDQVKKGEAAFTEQEERGYAVFTEHCASCHAEPLFSDYELHNNGLLPDASLSDAGRARISHQASDSLFFKTPSLRNIEYTYPYMHDGRFRKLSEVIHHYSDGHAFNSLVDDRLRGGIHLSEKEEVDLIAFLLTLTDREFLFAPEHQYPAAFFNATSHQSP